jgi:hypothetical protein
MKTCRPFLFAVVISVKAEIQALNDQKPPKGGF